MPKGINKKESPATDESATRSPGREQVYTKEDIIKVIEEYANSTCGLRTICSRPDNPSRTTFDSWINQDEDLKSLYTRAQELHKETMIYETIPIADDGSNDTYKDEKGNTKTDFEVVLRSRLRVETRLKIVSSLTAIERNKILKKLTEGGTNNNYLVQFVDYKDDDQCN